MRPLILFPVLAAIALAGPTPAQETSSVKEPLVLCCSDWTILQGLMQRFEQEVELPELEEGQCYEARVSAGGELSVTTTDSCSDYLKLSADPGALMKLFEVETRQAKSMAVMMGSMSLARHGMKMDEIVRMADQLFDFPKQIAAIDLRLAELPDAGVPIDMELSLSPVEGTWFAQVIEATGPNEGGLVMLPGEGAQMVGAINIDFAALLPHLRGLLTQIQTLAIQEAESREAAASVLDKFYGSMQGTYSFTFDAEHGMRWIAGLTDPEAAKSAMQDPLFAAMLEDSSSDTADISIDAKAFSHREVAVLEQVTELDPMAGPGSSFAQDGVQVSTFAVAGDSMIGSSLADGSEQMKAMIDQVLDQKLVKGEIPGGRLIALDMKVMEIAESMSQLTGMPIDEADREEMPSEVAASLQKIDDRLVLQIKSK